MYVVVVDGDGERPVRLVDGAVGEEGELLERLRGRRGQRWGGGGGVRPQLGVVAYGPCYRFADYEEELDAGVHCSYPFGYLVR